VAINEFPIPTPNSGPDGIAAGPDGALWFTESSSDRIGRITTAGAVTEFPIPTPDSNPVGIAAGPDGDMWFTESSGNKIGRITPAGVITEFPVPTPDSFPAGITAGPDGALWFAESGANKVGRITTAGAVTELNLPLPDFNFGFNPSGSSVGIAAGPDGALWYTGYARVLYIVQSSPPRLAVSVEGVVGRITTAGAVIIHTFPATFNSSPAGIAAGPDGDMWFTEFDGNKIGRTTTAGAITEFAVPTDFSVPSGIAAGPDGNLWFTERKGNKIGQVVLSGIDAAHANLAIAASASPSPATAGQPLTYTLTVANAGPQTAFNVVVADALPAGAAFVSAGASQGAAPTQAGGVVMAQLGNLAAGATATVTIVVTPAAAGTLTNTARVATTSFDPVPANDVATVATTVNPLTPPATVVGLRRYGFHAQPTLLVVAFSEPMDPASAQDARNYTLTCPRRGRGRFGPTIPIARATLDAAGTAVTLAPARRLGLHDLYRLVIDGTSPTGVRDASGLLLDGAGAGVPGSDYAATLGRWSLAGPARAAAAASLAARAQARVSAPPRGSFARHQHPGRQV
jgi:virginiamycin B lyase